MLTPIIDVFFLILIIIFFSSIILTYETQNQKKIWDTSATKDTLYFI